MVQYIVEQNNVRGINSSAVCVICIESEQNGHLHHLLWAVSLILHTRYTIHVRTRCTPEKCFCLSALSLQSSACLSVFSDDVFSGQDVLFQCLGESLLDNAFMGYNACIFAYGQTGKI